MEIKYSEINFINNFNLIQFISWQVHKEVINSDAGIHHYKLLTYLSQKIQNGLIYEFGTHYGTSSLALSVNKLNKIITYDILNRYRDYGIQPKPENVELRIGNILENESELKLLLNADLIFIDVDHLGKFESNIYHFLNDNDYKGLLLLDDIFFNQPMMQFWKSVDIKKYDLTSVGHGAIESNIPGMPAGTGLVDFNNNVTIISE